MNEQPSYAAIPGQRWGTGSASVFQYLMRDLAQKPSSPRGPAGRAAGRPQRVPALRQG